jgi:hypothetical protein
LGGFVLALAVGRYSTVEGAGAFGEWTAEFVIRIAPVVAVIMLWIQNRKLNALLATEARRQ